jgi:hypothetical protein
MTPIVIPLRQFAAEHQLALPAIPQTPIVTTVPEHRLMMSWWGREIKIWRIEELDGDEMYPLTGQEEERGRKLISRIMLNVRFMPPINSRQSNAHTNIERREPYISGNHSCPRKRRLRSRNLNNCRNQALPSQVQLLRSSSSPKNHDTHYPNPRDLRRR